MNFSLEDAKELRRQLFSILKGRSSNVEIIPAEGSSYRVVVLQRDLDLPELPVGVEVIRDNLSDPVDNVNVKKKTPGVSSHPSKDLGKPLTDSNRGVEPPEEFRQRNREIQDLVKRYAMTQNIAKLAGAIKKLASRDSQIDGYLETIRDAFLLKGYKKNSPLWRELQAVFQDYSLESAETLLQKMRERDFKDGPLAAAKLLVSVLRKRNGLPPSVEEQGAEQARQAKPCGEQLTALQKAMDNCTAQLRSLGLKEEASKMDAMAATVKDICTTVCRLGE
jgi:hypothetical protein